jgi:uncharacterized membrane protein YvlD (DUF360 family)
MENPQHIIVASRRLRRICTGLIIFLPVICATFWVFFNRIRGSTSMIPLPVPVTGDLSGLTRLLAFLTELVPMTALIYGLMKLRELFSYYEKGLIFAGKNVACFRSLGRALIAWVICDVAKNSLLSIVLTLHNPPGQRLITIGLYSADFTAVFVGIVILFIAWVMDEARKIQEDQALII